MCVSRRLQYCGERERALCVCVCVEFVGWVCGKLGADLSKRMQLANIYARTCEHHLHIEWGRFTSLPGQTVPTQLYDL